MHTEMITVKFIGPNGSRMKINAKGYKGRIVTRNQEASLLADAQSQAAAYAEGLFGKIVAIHQVPDEVRWSLDVDNAWVFSVDHE